MMSEKMCCFPKEHNRLCMNFIPDSNGHCVHLYGFDYDLCNYKAGGWIELGDDDPAVGEHVLVYTHRGEYHVACLRHMSTVRWEIAKDRYMVYKGITHWHPLPKPPKA